MAKLNSTRTGNRRNTPQPATEPTRVRRSTRSQSRDDSESEAIRQAGKVQRKPRNAAARREDSNGDHEDTRASRARPSARADLSTVNEDPSIVIEDDNEEGRVGEVGQEPLTSLDAKLSGRVSGISGTTARTSGSTQELGALASEDASVLDALPDLSESSRKFLSGCSSMDMSTDGITKLRSNVQDNRSGLNRSRKRFIVDLDFCRPEQSSSSFVDLSHCLPSLHVAEGNESEAIGLVFRVANLAALASDILVYPHQEDAFLLRNIDAHFPSAFADAENSQHLAINTRIQYAVEQIGELIAEPNFDADEILRQVFFNEGNTTLREYNHPAKQGNVYKELLANTMGVIKRMSRMCSEESQIQLVERLKETYSWDVYVADIMVWVIGKFRQVKAEVDGMQVADVVQILRDTRKEVIRVNHSSGQGEFGAQADADQVDLSTYSPPVNTLGTAAQQAEQTEQPSRRAKELAGSEYLQLGSPRLAHGAKAMKKAMARHGKAPGPGHEATRSRTGSTGRETQAPSTALPRVQGLTLGIDSVQPASSSAPAKLQEDRPLIGGSDSDGMPHANDDDAVLGHQGEDEEELAFQTQQILVDNAEQAMRVKEARDAESNKENQAEPSESRTKLRLTDPQDNAEKIHWDSQDVSQDEGFQQSHRRSNSIRPALSPINKRNAPEASMITHQSPPKRVRIQSASGDDNNEQRPEAAEREQNVEIEPTQDPPVSSQGYTQINETAKRVTAMQFRAPQSRKPWTEEETGQLIYLIEEHGTSWSKLKEYDRLHILDGRDQVALKDKARNMKVDFLKAGTMLPGNFDNIALSNLMINKLQQLGIEYDKELGRRPDDVIFKS